MNYNVAQLLGVPRREGKNWKLLFCDLSTLVKHNIPHTTNYRDLVELQAANGDEFLQLHRTQGARNAQYTSKFAVTSLIEAINTWLE